ncbi:MAG: two-component sensor histidine kinase [Phycisphaerales bacterium]|nr:two-component sensor histidine kinase [Phycisphaerales bacterium]
MIPTPFISGLFVGIALGSALGAILLLVVSHRRNRRAQAAERRAANAERLAELGAMTSGLAHEIKNPLSSVVLNAQLLREGILDAPLPEEESTRLTRRVDSLARETSRLKDILEDFLRYAGRVHLDREKRDVRELIEELSDFVHPQSELAGVLLRTDLPAVAVYAEVDAGLLKQAILNLMLNSIQAMEATPPPARRELILRVENRMNTETSTPEVAIHVIDTGPGIAATEREAIFRPYISSRKSGSGLGLAVTRRIVEEHGGTILVFSEMGKGSDFLVLLPQGHSKSQS